jgi:hypothetical protein
VAPLPPAFLVLLAGAAALAAGAAQQRAVAGWAEALEREGATLGPGTLTSAVPLLLAALFAGRVILSLLPPGEPGGHRPRELASTWAASHLLGTAALLAWGLLAPRVGLPADRLTPFLVLWFAVAFARTAFLPASLVPRHAPAEEAPGFLARSLVIVVVMLGLVPLVLAVAGPPSTGLYTSVAWDGGPAAPGFDGELRRLIAGPGIGERAVVVASWFALLVLVAHGLRAGRRAPAGRLGVLLVLALSPLPVLGAAAGSADVTVALFVAGGAAMLVPWLRRADRRAGALAILAFAAAALAAPRGLPCAVAGLIAAVALAPRPLRGRAALGAGLAGLLIVLPAYAQQLEYGLRAPLVDLSAPGPAGRAGALIGAAAARDVYGIGWPLAAAAGVWGLLRLRRTRPGPAGTVEPARRELVALVLLVGIALALSALAPVTYARWADEEGAGLFLAALVLQPLAPVAALIAGLVLVRPERTR